MKKVALILLLSVACSVKASWLEKVNPLPLISGGVKTTFNFTTNQVGSSLTLMNENKGWAALIATWASYLSYKKSKRVRGTVNYITRKLGLIK